MTAAGTTGVPAQPDDAGGPSLECDLVLKGGLTSGFALAQRLTGAMDDAARVAGTSDPDAVADLVESPRPRGAIRRVREI